MTRTSQADSASLPSSVPELRPHRWDEQDTDLDTRRLIETLVAVVGTRTGRDVSGYKCSTLLRAITQRMRAVHTKHPASYIELLYARPDEAYDLADALLDTTTSFFRDAEVYARLAGAVVPSLFDHVERHGGAIRVWSAGCASGEEPYSLAILLLEEAARRGCEEVPIQIFASELHRAAIETARAGLYPRDIESEVGSQRLGRWFERTAEGYRVCKLVRDRVVITPHDVLGDHVFESLDLVACRHLVTSLQRALRHEVVERFEAPLRPGGFLVLGPSEVFGAGPRLRCEDESLGIYRKRTPLAVPRPSTAWAALHERLAEQTAAATVLVGSDDRVMHLSSNSGRFLGHPSGAPTADVFDLIRDELRVALRAALPVARDQRRVVYSSPVAMRVDDRAVCVVVEVHPHADGIALVRFCEQCMRREADDPTEEAIRLASRAELECRVRTLSAEQKLAEHRLAAVVEAYDKSRVALLEARRELETDQERLRSIVDALETSGEVYRTRSEALEQRVTDLDQLVAAAGIATVFLDRELRIVRFTPPAERLFCVRTGDRGRALSDFSHRLDYADLHADLRHALVQDRTVEREVRDDGGLWYLARLQPHHGEDGHVVGVALSLVEITQLKTVQIALQHAKDYAERIVEALPEPLLVVNADRVVVAANAAFCTQFELSDAQVAGCPLHTFDDGRWAIPAITSLVDDVLGQAPCAECQIDEVIAGLGRRVLVVHARRLDELGLVVLGIDDLTERVLAEEALLEANRDKDEYLAMLGHELRNPLAAIRSAIELVEVALPDDTAAIRAGGVLTRQATHMSRIIDRLLEVSRLTRGKVAIERSTLDLRELIACVVHDSVAAIRARGLTLRTDLEFDPLWVDGDRVRLVQIFDNLLGNAIKFTDPPGDIAVDVTVDERDACAVVTITDSGRGIEPDNLARIFESFHQEPHNDSARAGGGLGLGLALARTLVELHGGTLSAASEGLGRGASFTVRLPVAAAPAAGTRVESQPVSCAPLRILVVEDNRDAAVMLRFLLERSGHEVVLAGNARDALDSLAEARFDVVLCDLGLPGMNGLELAREVRARPDLRGVKLLALTGYGQPEDRARCLDAGFVEHIVKPVDMATLDATLVRATAEPSR